MAGVFTLEKDGKTYYEKELTQCVNGAEFFLVIYKGIECTNNIITIKGSKDADLPLKIKIPNELLPKSNS